MAEPVLIAKAAAAALSDDRVRKGAGWVAAAIFAPLIVLAALICALGAGSSSHNVTAVELCFGSGPIPDSVPEEYRIYIEDMRSSLALLDESISAIDGQAEDGKSLDAVRVKAIFYALFFGEESPSARAHREFADCFVNYEERTRAVEKDDGTGQMVETEEVYTVAIPIEDLSTVYGKIASALGLEVTEEQKSNADSIYNLLKYGTPIEGGGAMGGWTGEPGELGDMAVSVDGFVSPLGAGWRSMVSSECAYRICPYHGRELHSGLDMAAPAGTPIRAALSGTVIKSTVTGSYGNYTVIDHGGGLTTGYAHQSRRLVSVGQHVEAGEVIGLVGSTGNSTGPHLHLEVRINGQVQNPRNYLP